jgi:hypothetical protein
VYENKEAEKRRFVPTPGVPWYFAMEVNMTNSEKGKSQECKDGHFKRLWNDVKANTHTAKFWVELVALIVVCLYTHYASQQADAALTANRPYVGVNGLEISHVGKSASGQVISSPVRTDETSVLHYAAQIKNFGPVPGTNCVATWKIFVAGVEQYSERLPDRPYTIFPGQPVRLSAVIGTRDYPAVMSEEKALEVEVTVEYDGPSNHYKECAKYQYTPEFNDFLNLGPLCNH